MKIAFTAINNTIDSKLSDVFGRTNYFILFDSETKQIDVYSNPNKNVIGAAGIQAAQFIISHNVDLVVTGHIGDNAIRFLSLAKIKIRSNLTGIINELIKIIENSVDLGVLK